MTCAQFKIPRSAAEALPIESILPGARPASVPNADLENSTVSAGVGNMRITCSVEMATYLVTRLTELATSLEGLNQTHLIIDCRYGVKAAFDAIECEIYGPAGGLTRGSERRCTKRSQIVTCPHLPALNRLSATDGARSWSAAEASWCRSSHCSSSHR
jgi:hypothetical protein